MTLKLDGWPLLHYIKLCASSQTPRSIQTGVTVWKHSIWVELGDFLSRVTLKFVGCPWKIGHLFYATSSFVHHIRAIGKFKLELQFGNAQFESKSAIFCPACVALNFAGWPWKTIGHIVYATLSPLLHFVAIGGFKLELQFGSKATISWAVWPWNFTDDLEKQEGTSPKQHQALCVISSSYLDSNWSYSPETAKFGYDLCDLDFWPLTLTFCMDITSVIGNISWKFRDDTMRGT